MSKLLDHCGMLKKIFLVLVSHFFFLTRALVRTLRECLPGLAVFGFRFGSACLLRRFRSFSTGCLDGRLSLQTNRKRQESENGYNSQKILHCAPPAGTAVPAGLNTLRTITADSASASACSPVRAAATSFSSAARAVFTWVSAVAFASAKVLARASMICRR